jgi:hypothetical protein
MKKFLYLAAAFIALHSSFLQAQGIAGANPVTGEQPGNLSTARIATVDAMDSVIFDLSKTIISGSSVSFPVSIFSDDTINALDFSFKYNQTTLTYDSIHNLTAYIQPLAYYSTVDSTVRFTSYSVQSYSNAVSLVTVHFTMLGTQLNDTDLYTVNTYLNGNHCSFRMILQRPAGWRK